MDEKNVIKSGNEKNSERARPMKRNLLLISGVASSVLTSVKPSTAETSTKDETIPTELKIYSTDLYCVLSEYSGAISGSIAVYGTQTRVYAVLKSIYAQV